MQISLQVAKHGQDVVYREVLSEHVRTTQQVKLQVEIVCNAYKFQSHAKVCVWAAGKWSHVHSIVPTLMKSNASYVQREAVTAGQFKDDRDELVRVATSVLAGSK